MKCRILTFVASALAILATAFPVCVGGGYGADLNLARMNVTTVGGGVPVAAASYGVGDLLSERFTGAEYDNTWTEATQGDGAVNGDSTAYSGTGFVGQHLSISGSSNFEANAVTDLGSGQSAVYFRFYVYVASESWNDGDNENIFTLAANGSTMGSNTYLSIKLQQVATGQLQLGTSFAAGASFTTGTGSYNINTETVYKVEGKVVDNGDSDECEWKVNGVSIGSKTGAIWASVAIQDVYIGMTYTNRAATVYFDTVDLSSTAYLTDTP